MRLIPILLIMLPFLAWPFGPRISEKRHMALGTVISLRIYQRGQRALLKKATKEINRYDTLFDPNKPQGDIFNINQSGSRNIVIDPDVFDLVKTALKYAELSGGYFDPTVGQLVDLWGIGSSSARIPSEWEIEEALETVDWREVTISEEKSTIILENPKTRLDLGGIAKGYICDRVADLFTEQGVSSALINMGGNVYALGEKPDGSPFKVGIQSPFHTRGVSLGMVLVSNRAVVTSGNYERFFEKDGVRYHHILDPKTGYPHNSTLSAVSVIADTALEGDALSTILFIAGLEEGLDLVNSLPGVQAVFVLGNGEVYLSDGLEDFFVLTHPDFILMEAF